MKKTGIVGGNFQCKNWKPWGRGWNKKYKKLEAILRRIKKLEWELRKEKRFKNNNNVWTEQEDGWITTTYGRSTENSGNTFSLLFSCVPVWPLRARWVESLLNLMANGLDLDRYILRTCYRVEVKGVYRGEAKGQFSHLDLSRGEAQPPPPNT